MKISKKSSVAVDLLIKMGIFPVHANLDLLKSGVPTEFSSEFLQAAQHVLANPPLDTNQVSQMPFNFRPLSEYVEIIISGCFTVKCHDISDIHIKAR